MPGFDRSGPTGNGPMTGGRRGLCVSPSPQDGSINYGYKRGGRGFGRGRGLARGWGGGYTGFGRYATSRADEKTMLQAEADTLKASLESIQKRLAELENNTPEQQPNT